MGNAFTLFANVLLALGDMPVCVADKLLEQCSVHSVHATRARIIQSGLSNARFLDRPFRLRCNERRSQLIGRGVVAVRHNADSVAGRDKCPRLKSRHATLISDVGLAVMTEAPNVTR
jgi:hypothetical protein